MLSGITLYILIDRLSPHIFGMHTVTLPILVSLIVFVSVSLIARKIKTIEDYHF